MNVNIPDMFNAAIQQTQVVVQQQEQYNYTKAIQITQGKTSVLVA